VIDPSLVLYIIHLGQNKIFEGFKNNKDTWEQGCSYYIQHSLLVISPEEHQTQHLDCYVNPEIIDNVYLTILCQQ
jgi:hypothetical protein